MSLFTTHTPATAPAGSKPLLEGVQKAWGMIPNLQAAMAESPELLAGYEQLWALFGKSSLSTTEQQVVYLTANYENECQYCMAGHTKLAAMQKIDPAIVDAIRGGGPIADAKLEALHVFATKVVRDRGFVGDDALRAFLAAGYTQQNALEVILGCAVKMMSNYTNHIVHTELDPFMKGAEWTKPVALAA